MTTNRKIPKSEIASAALSFALFIFAALIALLISGGTLTAASLVCAAMAAGFGGYFITTFILIIFGQGTPLESEKVKEGKL